VDQQFGPVIRHLQLPLRPAATCTAARVRARKGSLLLRTTTPTSGSSKRVADGFTLPGEVARDATAGDHGTAGQSEIPSFPTVDDSMPRMTAITSASAAPIAATPAPSRIPAS
jgi:hypothetical protein